ncbi:hypothetical protein FKB34_01835 [Glycocaulis profundi]|nr:hypothetical protein FKB34_01835 [Glycocaulis profundi]
MYGSQAGGIVRAPMRETDVFKHVYDPTYCNVSGRLAMGSGRVALGTVMALAGLFVLAADANAGNTGGGSIEDIEARAATVSGEYTLECIDEDVFAVFAPGGVRLADATVGEPYDTAQIAFTITASGAAFEAGDGFVIAAAEDRENARFIPLSLGGRPAGVSYAEAEAGEASDGRVLVHVRGPSKLVRTKMTYPENASPAQIAAIDAELMARGILVLDSANS